LSCCDICGSFRTAALVIAKTIAEPAYASLTRG